MKKHQFLSGQKGIVFPNGMPTHRFGMQGQGRSREMTTSDKLKRKIRNFVQKLSRWKNRKRS